MTIAEGEAAVKRINSEAESHYHLSGGARSRSPYGPQDVASEHKYEEHRRLHLQNYYRRIVKLCSRANELIIFGPGKAKTELLKEISRSKDLSRRVVSIKAKDKMTQAQIVAMVRKRFQRWQASAGFYTRVEIAALLRDAGRLHDDIYDHALRFSLPYKNMPRLI